MADIKNWDEFLKDIPTDILQKEIDKRNNVHSWNALLNSNKINKLSLRIMNEIDDALKQFGEYTFSDKGPDEVMNISSIVRAFEDDDSEEVGKTLKDILDYYAAGSSKGNYNNACATVATLISCLDDREDFDDILEYDNRFEY